MFSMNRKKIARVETEQLESQLKEKKQALARILVSGKLPVEIAQKTL